MHSLNVQKAYFYMIESLKYIENEMKIVNYIFLLNINF